MMQNLQTFNKKCVIFRKYVSDEICGEFCNLNKKNYAQYLLLKIPKINLKKVKKKNFKWFKTL